MMKILPGYDATTRINLDIPIQYIVSLISECLANSDLSAVPKKDTKKMAEILVMTCVRVQSNGTNESVAKALVEMNQKEAINRVYEDKNIAWGEYETNRLIELSDILGIHLSQTK